MSSTTTIPKHYCPLSELHYLSWSHACFPCNSFSTKWPNDLLKHKQVMLLFCLKFFSWLLILWIKSKLYHRTLPLAYLFNLISFIPLQCSLHSSHTVTTFCSSSSSNIPSTFPPLSLCNCFFLCLDCSSPNLADLLIFILQLPAQMLLPRRNFPWAPYLKQLPSITFSLSCLFPSQNFLLSLIICFLYDELSYLFIDMFVWPSPR